MRREILPNYRKKQDLLYTKKRPDKELIDLGDRFMKADRPSDALEFYQRAHHLKGLEEIKEQARQIGDVMLLLQASRALDCAPSKEDWQRTGENARKLKKDRFALFAFEKCGSDGSGQDLGERGTEEGDGRSP